MVFLQLQDFHFDRIANKIFGQMTHVLQCNRMYHRSYNCAILLISQTCNKRLFCVFSWLQMCSYSVNTTANLYTQIDRVSPKITLLRPNLMCTFSWF